jgi:hypothetical protein
MKIKCVNCNARYEFDDFSNITSTCEYCNEELEWEEVLCSEDKMRAEIVNLVWTKQGDSSSFNVSKSADELHFIGRLHHGSKLLCNILQNNVPIISKTHCSVEFSGNNVYLKDEGSTNGTYLGYEKISCTYKQLLKDNQVVWLANELFIVSFEFHREDILEPHINTSVQYRCRSCGHTFKSKTEECPNCKEYDGLIKV